MREARVATVELSEDHLDSDVGAQLVAELLDDLAVRYGAPDPDAPAPSDFHPPGGVFLVARIDGEPVGCGGVRAHTGGVGEIKRMYTRPTARRRGVGRSVLSELEARARVLGHGRLILETGIEQPEAIGMYEAMGYARIPSYGRYRDHPMSRCFGKDL